MACDAAYGWRMRTIDIVYVMAGAWHTLYFYLVVLGK
jgi:hypothetical protein